MNIYKSEGVNKEITCICTTCSSGKNVLACAVSLSLYVATVIEYNFFKENKNYSITFLDDILISRTTYMYVIFHQFLRRAPLLPIHYLYTNVSSDVKLSAC